MDWVALAARLQASALLHPEPRASQRRKTYCTACFRQDLLDGGRGVQLRHGLLLQWATRSGHSPWKAASVPPKFVGTKIQYGNAGVLGFDAPLRGRRTQCYS